RGRDRPGRPPGSRPGLRQLPSGQLVSRPAVLRRPGHPARGRQRRRRPAPRMVTGDGQTLVIAVLGLGEAGSVIARDLTAAGARVRGYDPAVPAAGPVL